MCTHILHIYEIASRIFVYPYIRIRAKTWIDVLLIGLTRTVD